MATLVAPCGFRCDRCLAFKENARTHADRVRGSAAWARYFHLQVPPQRIRCNGCMASEQAGAGFPDARCEIRPCVLQRGLKTCAECADYPCRTLTERMKACDKVVERFRGKIAEREFEACIMPYDCRHVLEDRRARRR